MENEIAELRKGLEDLRVVVGNIPIVTKESLQYKPPGRNKHMYLADALDEIFDRLNKLEDLIYDAGK